MRFKILRKGTLLIVWMIGLSGAGKTTLADAVVARVRETAPNIVSLDGDVIRTVFHDDLGHDMDSRRANSWRMMQLCKWLDDQDQHVVCAILSLFPEHRAELRKSVSSYYEVFIDAPLADLQDRDVKGLYARYAKGETSSVAGLDLTFPVPQTPDLTIRNDQGRDGLMAHVAPIADRIIDAK
ncbi:adenylyl-sulfate kinase [Yoonia sp. 208BN28-4]|uniref:adenylyl-sulfate kinase n=1 Tax=Yoonia sp. 208BN28-4 TaxID=3126505 RepID=UPI003095BF17